MFKTKLLTVLVAICAVIGLVGIAAPANAATPAAAQTAIMSSGADSVHNLPTGSDPNYFVNAARQVPASVRPNYPAGKYYYVCVSPSGSTVTVLYGETTVQVCNGAAAIQQYLESGQFVRTVQLTTSGRPATATFNPSEGCFLAIVAGGVPLLFEPIGGVLFVWDGAATAVTGGTECISN